MKPQNRTPPGVAEDFDLDPANIANACTKRLGNRFFTGKPSRQTVWLVFAVSAFGSGEETVEEAFAEPPDAALDALYLDQVDTTSQRHALAPLFLLRYNANQIDV